MEYKYITLKDGTKLYCGFSTGKSSKTIISIHGGPGNGFWDQIPFLEKLSNTYNVIAFDERGVNKSDEIKGVFTSEMLIDDIDEIRRIFNVDKAIFIGHSYGGHLLLRYCLKYSQSIEKAIFLCPSFDFIDSLHNVIELSKTELLKKGLDSSALNNALASDNVIDILQGLMAIPEDTQNDVYGYSNIDEDIMKKVSIYMPRIEEMEKSQKHQELVFSEGELSTDKTDCLKDIKCSSMLLVGEKDPVCTNRQIEKYKENVKKGKVEIIKNSYHFPYLDKIEDTISLIEHFAEE